MSGAVVAFVTHKGLREHLLDVHGLVEGQP
jgi:hypothetical protein